MSKRTIVIGASTNPSRYSHQAVVRLKKHGHETIPLGIKKGDIDGIKIINDFPYLENIHTITLYINSGIQPKYYDYILSLKPKRIIFNPGTENIELEELARENNIEVVDGCTLVMLSLDIF